MKHLTSLTAAIVLSAASAGASAEVLFLSDAQFTAARLDLSNINQPQSLGAIRQQSLQCSVEPLAMSRIQYRPTNGFLYGYGYRNTPNMTTLWRISAVNAMAFPIAVVGSSFVNVAAIEFNPAGTELRVIRTDINQTVYENLRVNPDTGAIIAVETPLSYANVPGGVIPRIGSLALSNDNPPRLLGIDRARGSLVEIGSAAGGEASWNTGVVTELTPINFPSNVWIGGMDISADTGTAYVQYSQNNVGQVHQRWLSTLDLTNGNLTVIAQPMSPGTHVASTLVLDDNVAPLPYCPADVNYDTVINSCDLSGILSTFGNAVPPPTAYSNYGDLNGDGFVNAADLSIMLSNFGAVCQ